MIAPGFMVRATESDAAAGHEREPLWSDEFDIDGPLDSLTWNFEEGFVRNHEDQWYQPQNAYCRDGLLIIECRAETRPNPLFREGADNWRESRPTIDYTSASVNTRGKRSFFTARLRSGPAFPPAPVRGPRYGPSAWTANGPPMAR